MASVYIETYGCTLSHSESEAIRNELDGHQLVDALEDAHIIVLNTCIVTETTERKVLKRIRFLCDNLGNRALIVTGCATHVLAEGVWARFPKATVVETRLVARYINSQFGSGGGSLYPSNQDNVTTRVKIAQGCEGRCSYCVVRLARGRTLSRPIKAIEREIELRVRHGAKQVLLAAQDAGVYGVDIGSSLPELINVLCNLKCDFKMRIGMMSVRSVCEIKNDLLDVFDHPKVYKFVHLPVQSGSNRVLRLMKRGHTVLDFERCVSTFARRFPELTISTDFIVGFPTETESDFRSTLELLRRAKPVKVNITRFSPRSGTDAAALEPVTSRIVKDRSRMLTAEHHRIAYQQNSALVGESYNALAVEHGKHGSTTLYNDNFRPIVTRQVLPLGTSHDVTITGATPTYLRGDVQ